MVYLQSFCLEFLLLFLLSCFSSDMVCLQRFFVFVLFIFSVNFTNLSWKEFNIILIISIYWVELYLFCFFLFMFFVLFLFGSWGGVGGGGCISIHEKDRILYICTSLRHLVFPFPPPLIAVSESHVLCCAIVLWFHLLALLNLGTRLQGFIWRSADKVPAWKSEQVFVPCNWWHHLGVCWSAYKTKPLQTGVKCSWVFLQNKSCFQLSLFCMRTDDWLNFHVKFQSIHVNITNTTHQGCFVVVFFFT